MAAAALRAAHGWPQDVTQIVVLQSAGDRVQDRALSEIGGKGVWTKELDRALLGGDIDCAVHSMKDVETVRPDSIAIAAMLERAAAEDRLIGAPSIDALRKGAVIGTSSPRRAAQMRALRPDFSITLFRGNVATRLDKVARGEADATLLAAAGLNRLGHADIGSTIPSTTMLPAPAQGAVGIECRAGDHTALMFLAAIDHAPTSRCVRMERAFLAALGGNCHSPIAALARIEAGGLALKAQILLEDGSEQVSGEAYAEGDDDGVSVAAALAQDMLGRASPALRGLFTP